MNNWTLLATLTWTATYFSKHKIATPRLDAEVLLAHLLDMDRVQLYVNFERVLTATELAAYKKLIQRRTGGEPVAYITGTREFYSLSFKVGPGVMVPRPETEILVEAVVSRQLTVDSGGSQVRILDIGAGSGNIAISLAKKNPRYFITAIDKSMAALDIAKENVAYHGVQDQIELLESDFLSTDYRPSTVDYDIVVSNPPYIPTSVILTLAPEVRDHEPRAALAGGEDGLDFYRRMGDIVPSLLKPGGLLAVEIGEEQAGAVTHIFANVGLQDIAVIKDYAGQDRVVTARL